MKYVKGAIYLLLGIATPWSEFLASDNVMDQRSLLATGVASLVSGLIALKAWTSEAP